MGGKEVYKTTPWLCNRLQLNGNQQCHTAVPASHGSPGLHSKAAPSGRHRGARLCPGFRMGGLPLGRMDEDRRSLLVVANTAKGEIVPIINMSDEINLNKQLYLEGNI